MSAPLSIRRSLAILGIGILILGIIIWQIAKPLKIKISDRFTVRGDVFLIGQQFELASSEYHKALAYNPKNEIASQHLVLAEAAPVDIALAKNFFAQHQVVEVGEKLALAQKKYATAKEALKVGVSFYANHEFNYARYPLERAVQLDPDYPEAWHYLGLTYQEFAKEDARYKEKAEAAFKKRNSLTPKYLQL